MAQFFKQLPHLSAYLVLGALWLVIVLTNYTPGTWLIGWDNLLPELDFGINISRTLTPVWQESQGFGLLGGIGHASEITRQLILWLFSFIMPTNMLRYGWTLGMLLLGGLGTYHLLLSVIKNHFNYAKDARLPALAAAVFYIFNPATIQNFYAPLEAFSSFYGFLPWIMLFFVEYFYSYTTKNLFKLLAILVVASSAFHVQTLFIVLCMVMSIFAIEVAIKKKKNSTLILVHLAIVLAAASAFWFLPVGYFATSSADATILSKQNQLATTDSHLLNQSFGGFFDTITHRGYWLEYTDLIDGKTDYMFENLRDHLYNPIITLVQIVLALIAVAGLVITTLQKRALLRWSFLGTAILSLGMLSAGSGVLGLIFKSVTEGIPLFYQMFRVTFTKWSVVYALLASIGIGSSILFAKIQSHRLQKKISIQTVAVLISVLAVITVWPIFHGQFFYDQVQLKIPNSYFSLFAYFKTEPEENRVLMLPAHTFWDWRFHDWGYRGSGFIWYGIKQPIIDRNFDVWSRTNETFYTQLSKAITNEDAYALARLLRQYDVSYIVIDESVTLPEGDNSKLRIQQTKEMLSSMQIQEVWNDDFLHVFAVPNNNSFLSSPNSYTYALGETSMLGDNPIYRNEGNYISEEDMGSSSIIYPYASLTHLTQEDINIVGETVRYQYQFPDTDSYTLTLPSLTQGQSYMMPVTVEYAGAKLTLSFLPLATIESGLQEYKLESIGSHTFDVPQNFDRIGVEIHNQIFILQKDEQRTIFLDLEAGTSTPISIANAQDASFENGRISFATPVVQQETIPVSVWEHLQQATTIEVNGTHKTIEIIVPTVENNINLDDTIPQQTQKCDVLNRGTSHVTKEYGTLLATADDRGAICHGWELDQSITSDFHLLRIKGNNIQGRPLKVFIEHLGKKQIVQEFLTPENEYDVIYSLPSWNDSALSTYALNVETRSLGGEKAENNISTISQYQLPLHSEWFTDVTMAKSGVDFTITGQALISNKIKVGTHSYIATVTAERNSVLVLEQAYAPGWFAFSSAGMLRHVEYNGWANAWHLPEGTSKITLLYAPQLLHFLGLGLLAATCIYLHFYRDNLDSAFSQIKSFSAFNPKQMLSDLIHNTRQRLLGK